MERKATRPSPVTSGKKKSTRRKKTKSAEPDVQEQQEAIASILPEPTVEKPNREDVTDEQFDQHTHHIFEGDDL